MNSYRNIRVAKYIRLSREDGDDRESESVENQRDIIDNYILGHKELIEVGEYVDDGYTGTNFNRPGFQRLLKDLKFKKVDTVITKIYLYLEGIILMQVSMFKNSFQKTILDILQY